MTITLALPLVTLNLWVLSWIFEQAQPLVNVLIVANVLAFILDYPVQLLQNRGIQRSYGILLILLIVFIAVGTFTITLAPDLFKQFIELTNRLPSWIDSGREQLQNFDAWYVTHNLPGNYNGLAQQLSRLFPTELKVLPNQLMGLVVGLTDRVIDLLVTAVFTLYLLIHGRTFWDGVFLRFPTIQHVRPVIRQQFRNYFLGQVSIATLMGISLTIAFHLLKIPYWLVFGVGIGATVLIPFGDILGIAVVSGLVALKSIGLGTEVLIVSILIDQLIDNAIAPRILGRLVGLNPVWVLISLVIGAQIGGLIGILIAVPFAGAIKVVLDSVWPPPRQAEKELSLKHPSVTPLPSE
ncbi:AI-2E family transporter [Acaryochloris sp. CCMEE 5410]|uniref:AI-2E family transporter n=1 Tax=Acaryochloris sp. CCMEE 5410 TaxID=310037 RepID=UPI0015849EE2|nr:AI-2E family transporter [Acaryochloris sp. CCMEE 5410]KAI9134407.1 AI-2E family transporter [Acaryochloris sp. CCMEE 5410]